MLVICVNNYAMQSPISISRSKTLLTSTSQDYLKSMMRRYSVFHIKGAGLRY